MSQWNNSYGAPYNASQYPDPASYAWSNDPNNQYANQTANYYPNRQYVGFNEFVSQIQGNEVFQGAPAYNNGQFPNYNTDQLNYTNPVAQANANPISSLEYSPDTAQNLPNGVDRVLEANPNQYRERPFSEHNDSVFTSTLTATATEFVPKSVQKVPIAKIPLASTLEGESSQGSSGPSSDRENGQQRSFPSTSNPKSKRKANVIKLTKEPEAARTFYNSSVSKPMSSQDVRTGGGRYPSDGNTRGRNYGGSQRLRGIERNSSEDEHFADSYLQQRDERRSTDQLHDDRRSEQYRDDRRTEQHRDDRRSEQHRDDRRSEQHRDDRRSEQHRDDRRGVDQNRDERRSEQGRDEWRSEQSRDDRRSEQNRDDRRSDQNRNNRRSDQSREDSRSDQGRDERRSEPSREERRSGQYRDDYRVADQNRDDRKVSEQHRDQRRGGNQHRDDRRASEQYREERRGVDRNQTQPSSRPAFRPSTRMPTVGENSELTQRERLGDQLDRGALECLVCCERVRQVDAVWSCSNCFHVLHLKCIQQWAVSSLVEGKWRCPACQNTSEDMPTEYWCFCGAVRSPEWVRGAPGAHTCGRSCRRVRSCPHPCTLLCHPGPCPPCQATLNKKCGCGAETRSVTCSSKLEQVCSRTCGRTLSCGTHSCSQPCHEGACAPCTEVLQQVCHCPAAKERTVVCMEETAGVSTWECGDSCGHVLPCGAHVCRAPCHAPPCAPCALRPDHVLTCPCGKMRLEPNSRKTCMDPIPLCGNICAKPLTCGPIGDRHFCKLECHDGACPVCPESTLVSCRCGHSNRDVPCSDLPDLIDNVFCQKKCNKKLSCGRHRCRELCCALESHRCPQVCGRMLSCQLHRCDNLCHTGHCPVCPRLGFSEIRCECGTAVLLPPVACGARPPACSAMCARVRPCRHPPHHTCHAGECPPCVVLTTRRCYGQHEERKTIPCSQDEFSCGMPCGKPLPCGKHTCIKVCHKGACDAGKCTQPCTEKRSSCGHECGAPCHSGACPSPAPCRRTVRATCPCGRRTQERQCSENSRDFAKLMSTMVAGKMQDGSAVDLSEVSRPGANLKTLECDDECRVEARTRQMALVLQIRNPDVSSKLAPRYSEHVRQWAARDPAFAEHVHERLTELVQRAKKSKQKTRSHSFPSMNRQKRQFVHELCEHFGCDSVAYDAEPNRNVVATADKEKSWLPAMSVIEVLGREAGRRRVPGPVLRPAVPAPAPPTARLSQPQPSNKSSGGWATLTSSYGNAWGARSSNNTAVAPVRPPPPIDYFDNPPDN